jgi:Dimethlysulfonioproprionate lyase
VTYGRSKELQQFIDALAFAFDAKAEPEVRDFRLALFAALAQPSASETSQAEQLPICSHLPAACQLARSVSLQLAQLTTAFERIESMLCWKVRPLGGPHASSNWPEGHANAVIIGQGGL